MLTDGARGFVGGTDGSYVVLWPIERLPELNEAYAVDEFAPGLLLIGSDGGGEAYAFDFTSELLPVVAIPFIPMDRGEAQVLASSFTEFLEVLHRRRGSS